MAICCAAQLWESISDDVGFDVRGERLADRPSETLKELKEVPPALLSFKATYRDNYQRLAAAKMKYEPENFFNVNQNIRPA